MGKPMGPKCATHIHTRGIPLTCSAKVGYNVGTGLWIWAAMQESTKITHAMLTGVRGKTSAVTTAMYKHFGDNFQHPPQMKMFTLHQLQNININPDDLEQYFKAAQEYHLNGVLRPFYCNWAFLIPPDFLPLRPFINGINFYGIMTSSGASTLLAPQNWTSTSPFFSHPLATDTSARAFLI